MAMGEWVMDEASSEVPPRQKAMEAARRNMIDVELDGSTVQWESLPPRGIEGIVKPASEGTGIIAGKTMRAS